MLISLFRPACIPGRGAHSHRLAPVLWTAVAAEPVGSAGPGATIGPPLACGVRGGQAAHPFPRRAFPAIRRIRPPSLFLG